MRGHVSIINFCEWNANKIIWKKYFFSLSHQLIFLGIKYYIFLWCLTLWYYIFSLPKYFSLSLQKSHISHWNVHFVCIACRSDDKMKMLGEISICTHQHWCKKHARFSRGGKLSQSENLISLSQLRFRLPFVLYRCLKKLFCAHIAWCIILSAKKSY